MEFKTIPNFTAYEVSRCGTVVRRISNQKEVKQAFQMIKGKSSGYLYCTLLFNEQGQYLPLPKRIAVHRLVAFAWLSEPEALMGNSSMVALDFLSVDKHFLLQIKIKVNNCIFVV